MRAVHLRLVLVLDLVAAGAAGGALVLAIGLPLASQGRLGAGAVVVISLAVALAATAVGAALLLRHVGRPVDRLLAAAGGLGARSGDLPILGDPGDPAGRGLSGAAVAFERLTYTLAAERGRLAEKVAELEAANAELVRARESLVRAERLATAGRLASGIAHEVGNPLGAITGYVELARDRLRAGGPGVAEADDFLARIGVEAQRIDRIVRDLLDLARPAEQPAGPVGVEGPLDAALRLARMQGRFRAVEVELAVPAGLPPVTADAGRLAQVFLNLFLNAGDAMGGKGRVRVAARADAERVSVEVRDSGPGISARDLPRVFEPFFTTKGAGQGTGLGLAISQGIVESFGGELSAANAPEGGAVFTLSLRAAPAGPPRGAC